MFYGARMKIWMSEQDLENLAVFLNAKYEIRRLAAKKQGKSYSITKFAKDIGIGQPSMSRYMKLGPDKTPNEIVPAPGQ
jgi:hypothetical protein